MECVAPDRQTIREWRLFSDIPWSIPIPLKDYPLIVGVGWLVETFGQPAAVKNHTFLPEIATHFG
jgi:hypothetical protein